MSKQQKTEHASPPRSDLFRIAEMQHMRRLEYLQPGKILDIRYQCDLCMEKSADEYSEILHKASCPVLRVK